MAMWVSGLYAKETLKIWHYICVLCVLFIVLYVWPAFCHAIIKLILTIDDDHKS